ncbi:MAG: S9 family peptidase [Atopostipes suicloacalis]|nr:S9 family peptidase [Atopostipes suicloacalis]
MKKLSNESIFDLKNVSQTLVEGKDLFYIETETNKEENDYLSTIYQLDLETKKRTHFGDSGRNHTQLKISPDKKYLTYLSNNNKDKKMQLFIIPLTGGSAVQLTDEKNGVSHYLWVKESQSIYYETTKKENDENNEDKNKDKNPSKSTFTRVKYKEDGRGRLDENKNYQIKKIKIEGLNKKPQAEVIIEEERSLSLSYIAKDESYLLYFDRYEVDDEWTYGGTIFKYDLIKKERKNLTKEEPDGVFTFALASEDEQYFLLKGNDFAYKFVTNDDIYLFNQKDESLVNLTKDLDFGVGDSLVGDFQQNLTGPDILWLEDGQCFIFKATEEGKIVLYEGNIDGDNKKRIDKKMHITSLALSENKKEVLISYSNLVTPSKLAKIDLESSEIDDLYDPNEVFMDNHKLIEAESFYYNSVKDWKIQAWYLPPADNTENHPAILYVHGGPQVSYGETFFHEMQVLSAKGYGVILINPRGGSGYGQEFVASILENYGDEDYQDLLNGLEYVIKKHPSIDEEKVFLAGGSYGGFMTNWMVTHTNRFKAAVTQRSISNWISFYGTSDVGPSFVKYQLGADLTKAEDLWSMSPLAHAQNAKTPLLIIHGEEDYRCPLEQGEQFYVAMQKYEVDTRLVIFPESSHGLSRNGKPNLRIERLEEIDGWFKKYS